jgi:hypothetical protein
MKKALVTACFLLFTASALAQQPADLESRIRQGWQDFVKKDHAKVAAMLTDDATEVWVDGKGLHDKASTLSSMDGLNISHFELSHFKFRTLGTAATLATYDADVEYEMAGNKVKGRLAVAELWVERGKAWKLLHYQETEVK